jgi:hypothetical protein
MSSKIAAGNVSVYGKVRFLICDSCFWCASILGNGAPVSICPRCKNSVLESIPIATGESYRFDYSTKRGVMLDFATTD